MSESDDPLGEFIALFKDNYTKYEEEHPNIDRFIVFTAFKSLIEFIVKNTENENSKDYANAMLTYTNFKEFMDVAIGQLQEPLNQSINMVSEMFENVSSILAEGTDDETHELISKIMNSYRDNLLMYIFIYQKSTDSVQNIFLNLMVVILKQLGENNVEFAQQMIEYKAFEDAMNILSNDLDKSEEN